jgi:hypothetical protein
MTQRVADVKWDVLRHVAYTLGIKGRSRQDIVQKVAAWAHGRVKEKGEEQPEEKHQEQAQKPASKLDSLKAGLASLAGKHAAATDVAALGEHLTQMAERMKGAKASQGVAEREGWDANAGMTPAGIARADQYLAGLGKAPPKPAPGHVRLYRGTNKGETAHESSFWTDERGLKGVAVPFASGHNRQLVYVDVPEAEAKKYLLGGAVTEGEYAGLPESLRKAAKTWGTPDQHANAERPAAAQQPSENVNKSGELIPAPKALKPKQLTLAQKARMARLERQKAAQAQQQPQAPAQATGAVGASQEQPEQTGALRPYTPDRGGVKDGFYYTPSGTKVPLDKYKKMLADDEKLKQNRGSLPTRPIAPAVVESDAPLPSKPQAPIAEAPKAQPPVKAAPQSPTPSSKGRFEDERYLPRKLDQKYGDAPRPLQHNERVNMEVAAKTLLQHGERDKANALLQQMAEDKQRYPKNYETADEARKRGEALQAGVKPAAQQPAPTPAPAAQKAKEPHEMTRDAFYAANGGNTPATISAHAKAVKAALKTNAAVSREVLKDYPSLPHGQTYEPWELTKAQQGNHALFGPNAPIGTSPKEHEAAVRKAVADGKPVPANVLADYPDLAAKVQSAPAAAQKTPAAKPPKQPHELPFHVFVGQQRKAGNKNLNLGETHRKAVEQAVKEGKSVPTDVLAGYPGLAAQTKELWQMTAAEYSTSPHTSGFSKAAHRSLKDAAKRGGESLADALHVAEGGSPYAHVYGGRESNHGHRNAVKRAIEEGKPVPAEVVKDYPHLAAKAQPKPSPLSRLTIPAPAAPAVKPRSIMEALKAASQRKLQAATLSATLKAPQGLYQKAYHPNGLIEGMQKAFPKHIAGYDNNNFYVKTKYGGPLAQFLKTNHVSAVWDREKGAFRVDRMYADKVGKFLHMNPTTYGRAEQPTTYARPRKPVTYRDMLRRMVKA